MLAPVVYYLLAPDAIFLPLHTFTPRGFIAFVTSTEILEAVQHDALEQCLSNRGW